MLANFEAEDSWNEGRPGLPSIAGLAQTGVVDRLEELGVWLASDDDVVLLREAPDPSFERYLRSTGLFSGTIITGSAEEGDEARLAEARGFSATALAGLASRGAVLVPMGNTIETEAVASAAGIRVSSPSVDVCARVNPKSFSQALCERLGVPRPLSVATRTLGELRKGLKTLMQVAPRVCVKESMGVSGRGIVNIDSAVAADRLLRMLSKTHQESDALDFVIEEWIDDAADVNYQMLIDEDGAISLLGVRSAQVVRGVHQGHRTPSGVPAFAAEILKEHGRRICEALRDETGYFGIVGIDALITGSGAVYPCLEINARLNMSTFQNRIVDEYVGPYRSSRFTYIRLSPESPLGFEWIWQRLDDLLYRPGDDSGVIVMCHATTRGRSDRRLYLAAIGDNSIDVEELVAVASTRLED